MLMVLIEPLVINGLLVRLFTKQSLLPRLKVLSTVASRCSPPFGLAGPTKAAAGARPGRV